MLRASWTGTDILGTEKGGRAGCRCLYRKERSSNFLKTSLSLVGMKGFEPSTSTSRTWRANRTALHPALKATQR